MSQFSGSSALRAVVGGIIVASGARLAARTPRASDVTKFISGVPVYNYNLAYGGKTSFSEGEASEQEWVVMGDEGDTTEELRRWCQMMKECIQYGDTDDGGMAYMTVRGSEADLANMLNTSAGNVKYVEPALEFSAIPEVPTPEDELGAAAATWGLHRIGADRRQTEGQGVHIFIMDTGIRHSHEDFGGRAVPTYDATRNGTGRVRRARSEYECHGAPDCAVDRHGHGTLVASVAAGATYGVAPQATLHSVKVFPDDGSPKKIAFIFSSLDWIATRGPRPAVASMSLSGEGQPQSMKDFIELVGERGVVSVVAGGNQNSDACERWPAFVPDAITVGSMDRNDKKSWFSNYGACVDIWAPGSDIHSASRSSDTSTERVQGTSVATPHVSGGVAILLGSRQNYSVRQIISELYWNTEKGKITNLTTADNNRLLFVGPPTNPTTPPTTTPTTTAAPTTTTPSPCPRGYGFGRNRDEHGNCQCRKIFRCWEDGKYRCTTVDGTSSSRRFSPDCEKCECVKAKP